MRTLVVSDLHLGAMGGRDVLRRPVALDALRAEVEAADRLVLLGDAVELLEGRPRKAMSLAREPLRALGEAMGRGGEVVFVAGNHDHSMVRPWLRARRAEGGRLTLATRLPARATAGLESLGDALGPVRLRVQYPGTWVAPGIYATHGHYVDRHLIPRAKGVLARGPLAPVPERGARADDYEGASGPSLDSMGAALSLDLPEPFADGVEKALGALRRGAMAAGPVAAGVLRTESLAPLTAGALGLQFRRAGLPAMAAVAAGLGVRARHLIFGHLHRTGPLPEDDLAEWRPNGRGPRLWNSGSWVYEPLLLSRSRPPHPYWPGGAVVVEDGAEPRLLRLLDDVSPAALG